METSTLRERVEYTVRNGTLRTTDFGSYDWDWLDHPERCDEVAWQLVWLDEAGRDSLADGFKDDAEAYFELATIIREEMTVLEAVLA